jgi:hypothetical protein
MKRIIPYIVVNVAVVSFAFGQYGIQKELADSRSEQEVRQAIEKYGPGRARCPGERRKRVCPWIFPYQVISPLPLISR